MHSTFLNPRQRPCSNAAGLPIFSRRTLMYPHRHQDCCHSMEAMRRGARGGADLRGCMQVGTRPARCRHASCICYMRMRHHHLLSRGIESLNAGVSAFRNVCLASLFLSNNIETTSGFVHIASSSPRAMLPPCGRKPLVTQDHALNSHSTLSPAGRRHISTYLCCTRFCRNTPTVISPTVSLNSRSPSSLRCGGYTISRVYRQWAEIANERHQWGPRAPVLAPL